VLIITKQGVESLTYRLNDSAKFSQCRDEVKKMVEIKSALLWRAETAQACCGWQLGACLASEVQILEDALNALEEGNTSQASSLLNDYVNQLEY